MPGPLAGLRVVELAGLGLAPFAAMMLADLGADVVRIDRPSRTSLLGTDPAADVLLRGRRALSVDLKREDGRALVLDLVLTAMVWSMRAQGLWGDARGADPLDSGAPFYEVYTCSDGAFLAVGAIEPQFHAELVARTGYDTFGQHQLDAATWPEQKERWAALFRTRPREEWVRLLQHTDACVASVLSWTRLRTTRTWPPRYVHAGGRRHAALPGPPRFSRTPAPRARRHRLSHRKSWCR